MRILLIFLLILASTGCNSIRYTKLKLVDVNPIRMLKRDVKRSERSSYIYLHFNEDSSAVYQLESVSVSDSSFSGVIMDTYTEDALMYYTELREKAGNDSLSRMRLQEEDRKIKLDQLHFWVTDTIVTEIHKNYRVGVNNIKDIEKVKRFDKRWLWLIYGLLIGLPIVLLIAAIISLNNMKFNIQLSMTG